MKLTNRLGLPQPIVDAATCDHEYTPKRYSVTQMLKGPREAILARRHSDEIESDVADMAWTIFGSSMHLLLEQSQESATQLKENYVTAEMPNGYVLSGIFDLYDDATGTVTDYKSATVWKVIFGDWDDYREQLLSYVWMLRRIGFDARRGEIVAILKDHSKAKAKFESNYPEHPFYVIGWDFSDEELAEFGERVEAKFREIERCEALPDDELPLCTPKERWAKPDTWAVMKQGNKKSSKNFDNEQDAVRYAARLQEDTGRKCHVEHRPGRDQKCLEYCDCRPFCNYGRALEV
ncbi:DUF2188 domain-containing protein [Adlercreutzia sp. R25]|uniref:DUF2188 domain-containing protein n=1 Tax=Adlercreutzia shanghongiae TaxID=3111773 RepID=A0ABU6IXI7_9ACTN|nr:MULTISPECIES: DUF2188 domain-containing protein [unclassified Adlercreutzia]MEC4272709.1 DUF2188 domain-containing protein [Adlercreutzia sp. R25]MEC4294391.1 DUF2188 domain-containing protein [Adlercreutzia sp. R22]